MAGHFTDDHSGMFADADAQISALLSNVAAQQQQQHQQHDDLLSSIDSYTNFFSTPNVPAGNSMFQCQSLPQQQQQHVVMDPSAAPALASNAALAGSIAQSPVHLTEIGAVTGGHTMTPAAATAGVFDASVAPVAAAPIAAGLMDTSSIYQPLDVGQPALVTPPAPAAPDACLVSPHDSLAPHSEPAHVPAAVAANLTAVDGATARVAGGGAVRKQPRSPRKRKLQREPGEPPRPVSAYALFFRDTQAAIKGHNPGATFGQVSRIVASMWEALEPANKAVYKSRADSARQQYVRELAAFRAGVAVADAPAVAVRQEGGEEVAASPGCHKTENALLTGAPASVTSQQSSLSLTRVCESASASAVAGTESTALTSYSGSSGLERAAPVAVAPVVENTAVDNRTDNATVSVSNQFASGAALNDHNTADANSGHVAASPSVVTSQTLPPAATTTTVGVVVGGGTVAVVPSIPPTVITGSTGAALVNGAVRQCARPGCQAAAVADVEWDGEYCSSGCVVQHCTSVFSQWVAEQRASAAATASG